jgi:D-alanyl-D-alanine carboxypeptidase/D-alanyl-D-alanine-endopeptidase (penicillin-binding protein 4)
MRKGWVVRSGASLVAFVVACCSGGVGIGQEPPVSTGGDVLGRQIRALVSDPEVVRAHWGVMVAGLDGTPIYALNEGQFFQPASNAKLFTTAAALALLGPEATFATKVVARGVFTGSARLHGDAVLVGSGDANLSGRAVPYVEPALRPRAAAGAAPLPRVEPLRYLAEMADQIAATGLKLVDGDVVGDDTLFAWEPYPRDWAIDDAVWGYGAPVSALSINDNQIQVTVTPGLRAGEAGVVTLDPAVPYYTVDSSGLLTGPTRSESRVQMERAPGSKVLRVYGVMALDAKADVEEVAIEDPAEYAAMALKGMLEARGIVVAGRARALHRPEVDLKGFLAESREPFAGGLLGRSGLAQKLEEARPGFQLLASHPSPGLDQDVGVTNKLSLNLHAELLLRQLGYRDGDDGTTAQGARVVRAFLEQVGVDKDDVVFYDGSGLSGHDLVTPRAVARLLEYAARQPWFAAYKASLPVGGVDGSLEGRFATGLLKGHVFAKTGTLGEARALSGYLECASGRTVVFSVMVNDHAPGTSADRGVMDKIVEAVAAAN